MKSETLQLANMKRNYVEKRLTAADMRKFIVPSHWLRNNGGLLPVPAPGSESEAIPLSFRDEWGKDYPLSLKVRSPKPGKKYFRKPEIKSKGWRALVTDKNLQAGESVYLWLDRGHIRIKVRDPPRTCSFFKGMNFLC